MIFRFSFGILSQLENSKLSPPFRAITGWLGRAGGAGLFQMLDEVGPILLELVKHVFVFGHLGLQRLSGELVLPQIPVDPLAKPVALARVDAAVG